jgi:hypothetical protein
MNYIIHSYTIALHSSAHRPDHFRGQTWTCKQFRDFKHKFMKNQQDAFRIPHHGGVHVHQQPHQDVGAAFRVAAQS